MLFSASLEAHMKAYMNQVKLEEINIEYQKMENKIIQDGLRMQMSQADILNKVDQMKEELIQQTIAKIIPFEQTAAPEIIKEKEIYKPLTASEYENKSKNPPYKIENRRKLIDELREKLQKRKQTKMLTEIFPEVNKREVNKLLDNVLIDLINRGLSKNEVKKGAENFVDDLIKNNKFANISEFKKIAPEILRENNKLESISKFKKIAPQILEENNKLKEENIEGNKLKIDIHSNRSSRAPTESSTINSPINREFNDLLNKRGNYQTKKKALLTYLNQFYKDNGIKNENMMKINKYTTLEDFDSYMRNIYNVKGSGLKYRRK